MAGKSSISSPELLLALRRCRSALVGTALLSAAINVLYLTGSFFMLQVYDRVIPSRSIPTLVALCLIAAVLFAFQGVLDVIRGRIFSRIGMTVDATLSSRTYDAALRLPFIADGGRFQPWRDLDQVRAFLSSTGPAAFFDLPWIPLYLALCFVFHWAIGLAALVGGIMLVTITWLNDRLSKKHVSSQYEWASKRQSHLDISRRSAEVIQAMGMGEQAGARWAEFNQGLLNDQQKVADTSGGLQAISKVLRTVLQSAVLAVGAYLVIQQEATGGIMIASSILTARALAPVEFAIGSWKNFISARESWARLSEALKVIPHPTDLLALPEPKLNLSVASLSIAPPGAQRLSVRNVSFKLQAGEGLGIIGASASGKSSLVRAVVGVWKPVQGNIRLDGAAIDQWQPSALGRHIGYLPQDVELFNGTIAENIARLDRNPDGAAVIAAAEIAGVHDMIVHLPNGYDSNIGDGGQALSAGQRQRVALARALYRDPFLIVLDEPNSNLDAAGEAALTSAIEKVRARGGIAIVVAHRPSALIGVGTIMIMAEGQVTAFGPKEEIFNQFLRNVPVPASQGVAPVAPQVKQISEVGSQS